MIPLLELSGVRRSPQDIDSLTAKVCKKSFRTFASEFWDEVPGTLPLEHNWHLDLFCNELQRLAEPVLNNSPREYDLCLNVSPGTSKSTYWSILFPAWLWVVNPQIRVLTASHTDELVLDLANKARTVIKSEKYQRLFPYVEIRHDQDTKGYYANTSGGDRKTCTIAGKSPVGFHGHVLLVDDPIDPKKVLSEVELKAARDFMTNVLPSRKVNKEVTVTALIMQRLGLGDPTDVMLQEARKEGAAPVRHVCLPAELTKGKEGEWLDDDVSPRDLVRYYQNGLMDSRRLGPNVLREFKARGEHYYATQFLQKPYAIGGGMFKDAYFSRRVKAAPYHARRVRYWDRASSTSETGCRTAGVLLSFAEGSYYVEDVVKGKWEPDERNQVMRATALKDRSRYGPNDEPVIYTEMEPGSSGIDAYKGVVRALAGFPVKEDRPSGKKEVRAEPWSSQLAAGNVYLVDDGESEGTGRALWDIRNYVEEHLAFPGGTYLDQVDSSAGAFNVLVQSHRSVPALSVYRLGKPANNKLQVVIADTATLDSVSLGDCRCLWVRILDHGEEPPTIRHTMDLLDRLDLTVADLDPAECQQTWNDPIPRYGKPASQLVMTQVEGKKLWSFLLKKRDPFPHVFVFSGRGGNDRRPTSIAFAVSDCLRMERRQTVHSPSDPSVNVTSTAPNRHVYETVRASRGLVV